jgi:hypothetical protein
MAYKNLDKKFVKIKDGVVAPSGFHYMPDGKLMSDADHITINGYIAKYINSFTMDTHDIAYRGETRRFKISGTKGAFFSLEVIDNADGDSYDFSTKTFTAAPSRLNKIELDGVYSGSIVFPRYNSDNYTVNLVAETVENIKTFHQPIIEARNEDGSLNLNKTTGSASSIVQKILESPSSATLRISCVAPSMYTAGVVQKVAGTVSSSNRVVFDSALALNQTPSGNIKPGDVITGTGVASGDWQLVSKVNPDNDNAREIELLYAQSIGDDVDLTFTPAFNGVTPHEGNSDTGSDSSVVSRGSSFTKTFHVLVRAPSGRLISVLKTPTENDVCCRTAVVLTATPLTIPGEDTSSSTLYHGFTTTAGEGVARLSTGMKLDPSRAVNTIEGSFIAPYVETETTQVVVNDGYNTKTTTNTIRTEKVPGIQTIADPTAIMSNGAVRAQQGNIVFNKQQVDALKGDTVNIYAYGVDQISKMQEGMTFSLSNVALGENTKFTSHADEKPTTLTTSGASSSSTTVAVTDCESAAVGFQVSGINIDPAVANPTIVSKSTRSGAGNVVLSAAQSFESGQKINVLGGYKAISIRGSITIKNFPVGADVDLLFDLERFLKVT